MLIEVLQWERQRYGYCVFISGSVSVAKSLREREKEMDIVSWVSLDLGSLDPKQDIQIEVRWVSGYDNVSSIGTAAEIWCIWSLVFLAVRMSL
jgi:hypothetical protein